MIGTVTSGVQFVVVPDYAAAERAIRSGTDSMRVVVAAGPEQTAAVAAATAGAAQELGPVPRAPYSCGKRCLVVLPTYNECQNLEPILGAVRRYLDTDVLVVDDGSPDGTGAIADAIAARDPRVRVLHRAGKQGLGTAYVAGFRQAIERGYERVFEMDADHSHPPWDLPRLAHASLSADLVIGSRYVRGGSTAGWSFRRRLLSRSANLYARVVLGMRVRDLTAGFRCYDVAKLQQIQLDTVQASGYAFQIEMAYRFARAGFTIVELPIHFADRRIGTSKMDGRIAREALFLVPRLRRRAL